MEKIGIVCDTYKLEMFKQELKKANIEVLSIKLFTKGTLVIVCLSKQHLIAPIVHKVTRHFLNNN